MKRNMGPRLRRVLLAAGLACIVLYCTAVAWLIWQETAIVFAAPTELGRRRPTAPFEQIEVTRQDRARQIAWVMRSSEDPDSHPWILYLHGNSSTVAHRLNIVHYEHLRALGLNVFAPEYRGFGGLDGVPTESGLDLDARAAYDYVRTTLRVPPERLVIYGWSLGSAVAVDLASHVDESALILEGAPSSLVAVGQRRYPFMPVRLVMRNPFESIVKIRTVDSPVLFLHSPEDEVIPFDEGKRLYDAAGQPKTFVAVHGGHVYAAERDPQFFPAIREFLSARHVLP
jgi:fermentation-respiration switch protein FrsA (DUF1100 family)